MTLLLDDFSAGATVPAAVSVPQWNVFTDRVMGGESSGSAALEVVQGRQALRMRGVVSLERNGGFVQIARALGASGATILDASTYDGVALTVRGTPGSYFVHLRTSDTRAPWQYYSAPLPVRDSWADVRIAWKEFTPKALAIPLNTARLVRIGIVAGFSAFTADLAVERISLMP